MELLRKIGTNGLNNLKRNKMKNIVSVGKNGLKNIKRNKLWKF